MSFGTALDRLVGNRVGGVNVFGGGLALYASGGIKVGGLGVSGDTSCPDHFVAWRVRTSLKLDHFTGLGGVSDPTHPDNIIYDITATPSPVEPRAGSDGRIVNLQERVVRVGSTEDDVEGA
jgi:hypothetical protein